MSHYRPLNSAGISHGDLPGHDLLTVRLLPVTLLLPSLPLLHLNFNFLGMYQMLLSRRRGHVGTEHHSQGHSDWIKILRRHPSGWELASRSIKHPEKKFLEKKPFSLNVWLLTSLRWCILYPAVRTAAVLKSRKKLKTKERHRSLEDLQHWSRL